MSDNGSGRTPQPRSRVTLTPAQQRTRRRFESVIGVAAPFLDLVLAVGERISRIAEPEDHEYYPVRAGELEDLPQGRSRPRSGE
jgi:hypothetical protein